MATHCFEGILESTPVHIGLTLGSGQVFRWGRDVDGWWKGIAYGVVVHLRHKGDQIQYRASSERVATYCGEMAIDDFLRWYLRLDHMPRIRVPRGDTHLRKARGFVEGTAICSPGSIRVYYFLCALGSSAHVVDQKADRIYCANPGRETGF